MPLDPIEIDQRLNLLHEMLSCSYPLYYWTYNVNEELLDTSCPELVLNTIFSATHCRSYMLEYGKTHSSPLILSAPLGLMWCAAFEKRGDLLIRIHVLGPVFSTETSLAGLERGLSAFDVPLSWKGTLVTLLTRLPVIAATAFFQPALMLHYCVTGQKLQTSDIHFQQRDVDLTAPHAPLVKKDRHQTWMAEQALLRMVQEGDLNYRSALERAQTVSSGVQVSVSDPLAQARTSQIVFISLCVRSAIQGGLSPEIAYSRGDAYIQSVLTCSSLSQLAVIGHSMYEDFIRMVHKCCTNPDVSKQVQSCCDYIQMHADEKLSLEALARRMGYTEYYLSRKFKKEMGVSINDYIKFAKIERAKTLLVSTRHNMQTISELLHFSTRSHFADCFKKITGVSPAEYRAKNQHL